MGKATRWLKGLLGKIRSSSDPPPSASPKKRWSFLKSSSPPSNPNFRRPGSASSLRFPDNAPNDVASKQHAIAVAAASAAAADAAVAAAQAAADVVRLQASQPPAPPAHVSFGSVQTVLEAWAALVIQSHFRGYLARRALRALKGLVKLQALVRGHILRKKTAETMRSIQAMLRAQERARSIRAYESPNSSEKSSQTYHRGPPTPEKFEQNPYIKNTKGTQSAIPKASGSRIINRVIIHPDQRYQNFEDYYMRPDKILEMDTGKPPLINPKRRKNVFESIGLEFALDQTVYPHKRSTQEEEEEIAFCTAENSPQCCYSASSRGGFSSRKQSPMTPTKSDASATSCVSSYSDCPSYMAYTESSRAKMRSLSVPRQRPQQGIQHCQEKMSSTKRLSVYQQRVASSNAMQACFASKAYAGSGRLDRLGVPSRNNATTVYYSGCLE